MFDILSNKAHIDLLLFFFFFNDTATTEIYTLSLHDALPICHVGIGRLPRQVDQYLQFSVPVGDDPLSGDRVDEAASRQGALRGCDADHGLMLLSGHRRPMWPVDARYVHLPLASVRGSDRLGSTRRAARAVADGVRVARGIGRRRLHSSDPAARLGRTHPYRPSGGGPPWLGSGA